MSDPVVELPFYGGIDQLNQDELVEPGRGWPVLENVRQGHLGALTKRPGYTSLPLLRLDGSSRSAGYRLFMNGEQLCVIDGSKVDVYSPTAGCSTVRNRVPEATYQLREAPNAGMRGPIEDSVVVNGYVVMSARVVISNDMPIAHGVTVVDEATGTVVSGPSTLSFSSAIVDVRLATYGTYALAFTAIADTDTIAVSYLDLTSRATIAAGWVAVTTLTDWNTGFDCANVASNDRVAIAYGSTGNGNRRIVVKTLTIAGVTDSRNITPTNVPTDAWGIGLAENADTLWLAYFDGQTPMVFGLNPATVSGTPLASTLSLTALAGTETPYTIHVCARPGSGKAQVYIASVFSSSGITGYPLYIQPLKTTAGAAATDGAQIAVGGALPMARPFLYNSRIYCVFASAPRALDGALCDVTYDTAQPYARPVVAPLERGLLGPSEMLRCRTMQASTGSTRLISTLGVNQGAGVYTGRIVEYDFADEERWRAVDLNGSTFLGGGVTCVFDGNRVFESAFLVAPAQVQVDASGGSGQTFTHGRRYVATYEQIDADGNAHVSGVSDPCDITGPVVNKAVVLYTTPCGITARIDETSFYSGSIRVVFWATLDANDGEPPYYRIPDILSWTATRHVHVFDIFPDSFLENQPLLYGTGSLPGTGAGQDHRAPPGLKHIVAYNGMLVGAAGRTLYFTSQPIDGEGQWWSPLFTQPLDGEVTALETLDGTIYAFTRTAVYAAAGEPPSDNAAVGGIGTPRKLAQAIGCIGGPTLSTSFGIVYRSDRGIEMLNRSGSVVWIGERMRDTLASFPVVTGMAYDVRNNGLVRIALAAARTGGVATGDSRELVYDADRDTWVSVDNTGVIAQSTAMIDVGGTAGRYACLSADGTVHVERLPGDTTEHLDGSSWVTQAMESPWIKVAGINGEQLLEQLLLLAEQHTAHDLKISLAFDYVETFGTPRVFTAAEIALLAREWLVTEMTQTTSAAVKVRIEDATPSSGVVGTGKGSTWIAMTVAGRPQRGPKRSSAAQRGAAP